MKMATYKFAQDEVTHQRLRVGSKKRPSSKATAIFTRGAYTWYVSTEKWRERRWRLFSTDPQKICTFVSEVG